MATLTARLIADRRALDHLVPEWTALLGRAANGAIFSTPEWQLAWLDVRPEVLPRYIEVRDTTNTLRALLPLALCPRRVGPLMLRALELSGEAIVCGDHLGLVSSAADQVDAWAAAAPLVHTSAGEADVVRFASVDASEAAAMSASLDTSLGWHAGATIDDVAPRMPLPADGADVLELFGPSRAKRLRYYERRFATSYPSGAIALNDERMPLDAALDALSASHASRWQSLGESGVTADATFAKFLRRFAHVAHDRGWLRLYQTIVDDRVVASLFVLHWSGTASAWLLGWNPEFGKWNVADLLWVHSMRNAAREGLRTYDFLRGRDPYKFRFPVESPELITLQWNITARGRLSLEADRMGEQVLASARRWRTRAVRVARKLRPGKD